MIPSISATCSSPKRPGNTLPWMKEGDPPSSSYHRLNMVRLAVDSNPFFRASSLEIDRPGPTYTVDTLDQMHQDSGDKDDLYFILGIDSYRKFHTWKEPARVLELATLIAVTRPGHLQLDLGPLSDNSAAPEKVVVLEGLLVDISGTEIRRRVSLSLTVRYQVPDEVERYIYHYSLYRDEGTSK